MSWSSDSESRETPSFLNEGLTQEKNSDWLVSEQPAKLILGKAVCEKVP